MSDKIQRISVTSQIYDYMVKKISNGEWKAGEKIPSEITLSKTLGVSRVSVKMAIEKLNTLGITETKIGEGTYVQGFSLNNIFSELAKTASLDFVDITQLNGFRILLEYCTMRLVVLTTIEETELWNLQGHLDNMEKAIEKKDDLQFHNSHFKFHLQICKMAKNQYFIELHNAMSTLFYELYKKNSEKTWETMGTTETINHHRNIFQAIQNRDLEKITRLQDELLLDEVLPEQGIEPQSII